MNEEGDSSAIHTISRILYSVSSDDESELGTSSREYLESPAKARREALKQKLQKEGFHGAAMNPDLKSLKLSVLKADVAKERKDRVSMTADDRSASRSFGTKTREQEIKVQSMGADAKPGTDQLVEQGNARQKADDLLKRDEAQSEDA